MRIPRLSVIESPLNNQALPLQMRMVKPPTIVPLGMWKQQKCECVCTGQASSYSSCAQKSTAGASPPAWLWQCCELPAMPPVKCCLFLTVPVLCLCSTTLE